VITRICDLPKPAAAVVDIRDRPTDIVRYLLSCEALSSTKGQHAFTVFERVFKEFGLPQAIRTDNGAPFASPNSLFGLSKLSVKSAPHSPKMTPFANGCSAQSGENA
jgi:putative transposase